MRLIRLGPVGNEKPGIIDSNGSRRDLSSHFEDWNTRFFGAAEIERFAEILKGKTASFANPA